MNLFKTKTFWAAIAALAGAIGGYVSGEINLAEAITAAALACTQIFQRTAIEKAGASK